VGNTRQHRPDSVGTDSARASFGSSLGGTVMSMGVTNDSKMDQEAFGEGSI
jgi:hypothetical protein